MLDRNDLHPYQISAGEFVARLRKCGLFLDMGLGKTAISLTATLDFLDDVLITGTLIIAPLRVANNVWHTEAKNWAHLKGLKISICTGSPAERKAAIEAEADIHIINRENIPWLLKNMTWKWDMVIVDESSSFKSHKTLRFKGLKKITKYTICFLLLTGTPSPNSMLDLWAQIYLLDGGERLGKYITHYRAKYFYLPAHSDYKYELKAGAYDEIMALISDICISMKAEDYIDMPERINIIEHIDLPPAARAQYNELEKEYLITMPDGTDIEAPSQGVLYNKLLQICNGSIYDEHGVAHHIHDEKVKALREIIDDNPNENFLVAYTFRSDLERLQKAFPEARTLSRSAGELDDWNAGKIRMLLAHPASAGHGLNMQSGGSIVVWFGFNWSLELYLQFNARLYRQGQKKPVRVIHILAKNSMDGKVKNTIKHKEKMQGSIIDYLKHENK